MHLNIFVPFIILLKKRVVNILSKINGLFTFYFSCGTIVNEELRILEFLYALEKIRNPILDFIMSVITHLGEEILFIVIAVILLWCVDKYKGYYMLCVGFVGTQLNQLLKVTFKIDRPWVKDPEFKPIQSAIKEATGYSFPSGHTQSAVGIFGSIARFARTNWLRIISIGIAALVAFSRMYLGVHTPLDVGVSILIATVLVFVFYPIIEKSRTNRNVMRIFLVFMIVWSVAQVFITHPIYLSDVDNANFLSAVKNAYKMLGAVLGFAVVYELDIRFINFDTKAVFWAQILKTAIGLGLTLAIQEVGYIFFDLFMGEFGYRCATYFCMVVFAGAVWPLTFKWFAKLGKK